MADSKVYTPIGGRSGSGGRGGRGGRGQNPVALNPELREREIERVTEKMGGEGREGDWECGGCRNRNYAFKSFCNRCKQPRLLVDTKTLTDSKWLPRIGDWICTVSKSGIVESLLSWANFKQSKDLKKTDGTKRQRITGITKLEDANDAGGKSSDKCTLILTKGVSAKALAGKQKRNNRKVKDKGRDDKSGVAIQDILQEESLADERKDFTIEDAELVLENSDVSDSVDCLPEMQPDSEDRDTDTSEVHPPTEASSSVVSGLSAGQNGIRQTNSSSVVDDSSSTCSTDSVPSVVMNGSYKGYSLPNHKKQKSPCRGRNQRGKATCDATGLANEVRILAPEPSRDAAQPNDASESCKAESESEAVVHSLQDRIKKLEQHVVKKVVDAYALLGDVSGLAEKIQSFFMQKVLSVTHSVLKNILQEDLEPSNMQSSSSRLTYSDLCHQIPESKFRQCLLTTLAALFKLMSSYHAIMSFQLADKVMTNQGAVECIRNIKDAKAAAKHLTC